jgi:predicted CXXCH cytochrome family protein
MKLLKITFAAAIALTFTSAYAFHSGGVAECEGCHSMHSGLSTSYLLVGSDQSSACLTCHAYSETTGSGYHIMSLGQTTPVERTPGGDFAWVAKSYTYTTNTTGGTATELGQTHGHNIVAADRGYGPDTTNTTAPGGTFPAADLACNSCHDPHGKFRRLANGTIANTGAAIWASGSYPGTANEPKTTGEAVGVYRLLAGSGYTNKTDGLIGFPGVPAAKVPSTYNVGEATSQMRVAYGVGTTTGHTTWANWCATCHPDMHSSNSGTMVHPVDKELGVVADLYNSYVKSGNLTGVVGSSFSSLAPFTTNSGDYTALGALAVAAPTSAGPAATDQVNCMSCHRAHASGFMEMLRFDNGYEFMVKGGDYVGSNNPEITGSRSGLQHRGRTTTEWKAAYYDRPATQFATYQRVFCNKCHAKD